jgi:hypothetical protein
LISCPTGPDRPGWRVHLRVHPDPETSLNRG